jgi:bifunctional non-homologous end joining protein LigD
VAPYSVRARPDASVATPLHWQEVDNPQLGPRRYTIRNIFRRLAQKPDPWAGIQKNPQSLAPARRKLAALAG